MRDIIIRGVFGGLQSLPSIFVLKFFVRKKNEVVWDVKAKLELVLLLVQCSATLLNVVICHIETRIVI